MNTPPVQIWRGLSAAIVAIFLVAACAIPPRAGGIKSIQNEAYTGRLSLVVQSDPVQSFSGGFELRGRLEAGELTLLTPLGSIAAVLRWSPGLAQLQSGGQTQQYPSVQAMLEHTTGAAIPVEALFAWLHGDNAVAAGWQADISRHADGRISAQRLDPAPTAQLRIVLER